MAAGRRRVGVVVLVDPPVGEWVDGLRRAVGDGDVDRIRPHITLVPPLNLRAGDLDAALAVLRRAAAATTGPLRLTIGPPATFLPANPVLYLEVGGDIPGLAGLRSRVFSAPLTRDLSWPWVPHVTLADDLAPERIDALTGSLDRFAAVADIDRVTLLEERHTAAGRRWVPLADASLGPPAVVGRGGLELTLTGGRVPDPLAALLLWGDAAGEDDAGGERVAAPDQLVDPPTPDAADPGPRSRSLVVTAHREGTLAGAGAAWLDDAGGHVRVVVEPTVRGSGVGGHLLAALEDAVRRAGWRCPVLHAEGPAGFYLARSVWSRPAGGD